jgi:signal transduction histidine kinase
MLRAKHVPGEPPLAAGLGNLCRKTDVRDARVTYVLPVEIPRLRRPPWLDVGLAAAFLLMTVAEALLSPDVASPVRHVVIGGVAMASLAWRRQAPLLVGAIVIVSNVLVNPAGEFSTLLSLVLVCFTIGSQSPPPRTYVGIAVVYAVFVAVSIADGLEPSDLAAGLVFFIGPWAVGIALKDRIQRSEAAEARAARLEREREAEAARAAAEERTRIARELHDIVSHSISVVTIQTQAVRRRLGPDHQAEADDLAAVEATAREALAEMRRLFGVLRADGATASLTPQPGLSELDRLVTSVSSDDLRVRMQVEGDPIDLPPGVDLAAYRIAQEALTNTVRHSGATEATVLLRYQPTRLDIEVEDNGHGLATDGVNRQPGHPGHGLVGIRERVALYDGTVDLGASPTGGVRLAASLPLKEPV